MAFRQLFQLESFNFVIILSSHQFPVRFCFTISSYIIPMPLYTLNISKYRVHPQEKLLQYWEEKNVNMQSWVR